MKNIHQASKRHLGLMPAWQRVLILTGMLSCSLSGIAYLLGDQFDFTKKIFSGHTMLSLHGSTAVIAILGLGSVLTFHLKAGWRVKHKKLSGITQLFALLILMITGLLLYYGPEPLREKTIQTHWSVGLLFFSMFCLHALRRRA
jgi:Na+-transporting NADH:ubiquinone oxidoreductase subunit NqrB